MNYKELFKNFGKMFVSAVITLCICYFAGLWFNETFSNMNTAIFCIVKIIFIFILCISAYVPLNLIFKNEYAKHLFDRLINKIKGKLHVNN